MALRRSNATDALDCDDDDGHLASGAPSGDATTDGGNATPGDATTATGESFVDDGTSVATSHAGSVDTLTPAPDHAATTSAPACLTPHDIGYDHDGHDGVDSQEYDAGIRTGIMHAETMLESDGNLEDAEDADDSVSGPQASSSSISSITSSTMAPWDHICSCCVCVGRCGVCNRPIRRLRSNFKGRGRGRGNGHYVHPYTSSSTATSATLSATSAKAGTSTTSNQTSGARNHEV